MGRFATTAEFYEQYRPPYPAEFFSAIAKKLTLDKRHALIDLGTGPGVLAIGFAPYVGRVVGIDPEPAMLAAARAGSTRAGAAVNFIEGRAEELPADIGSFDVVTIGRALHWMDHKALGPVFGRLVAPGGAILICAAFSARDGSNAWLETYDVARRRWSDEDLLSVSRKGEHAHRKPADVLGPLGFDVVETIRVEAAHEVNAADLARRVLTFSLSSPAALGDKADAMLADIEARLVSFSRNGVLKEKLISAASVARRPSN
jgi:protein-L-isoaspartate O-methyltransferase